MAALSGESSLDTHRSSFGLIDGLFDWVSDYVVKEDHLYGCEIAVRIEASARANTLIAGSIVRIHLLRRQCQLLDETNVDRYLANGFYTWSKMRRGAERVLERIDRLNL